MNEAANGLVGSTTALTCLPGGATNVFGRILGIPRDVREATELAAHRAGDSRPVSSTSGRVNDRRLPARAGVGLDASVVERVDRASGAQGARGAVVLRLDGAAARGRDLPDRPAAELVEAAGGRSTASR